MSYEHYIRVDARKRIIDGFSTFDRQPQEGDILLRSDGGEVFDILGDGRWRPLYFLPQALPDTPIYEYAWTGEAVRTRTEDELMADIPPLPEAPDTGTRLADAEADIAALASVLEILLGG